MIERRKANSPMRTTQRGKNTDMPPDAKTEKALEKLPKNQKRVNVGIMDSHHQILKMAATVRGCSVQQVADLVLNGVLVSTEGLTLDGFYKWAKELQGYREQSVSQETPDLVRPENEPIAVAGGEK